MAAYISSILRGEVELLLVKHWIIGGSDLPPAPFSVSSPRSPSSAGDRPNITAEQFRVVLLNYVKEEADAIFLSSERHAADLHAKGQVAKEQSTQDPRSWHGESNPLTAPGTVNDNSFPALSFQSTKKDALDRRLGICQPPEPARAACSAAAPSSQSRKIAPTKVSQIVTQDTFINAPPFGSEPAVSSTEPFASTPSLAEASARDLCSPDQRLVWKRPSTPSSAGSTSISHPAQHKCADASVTSRQSTQAAAASTLTRHSAPAMSTPVRGYCNTKRMSPSPLGEAVTAGQGDAASTPQASAWQATRCWYSPNTSTSGTQACSTSSAGQTPVADGATPSRQPSCGQGQSQKRGSNAVNKHQAFFESPQHSAWGRSNGTARSLSPGLTPGVSGRSSPGHQSYQSRLQPRAPHTLSESQCYSSPGSTATSKPNPAWLGQALPSTPVSKAHSESGSNGTEYATPPSSLPAWRDFAADDSPLPSDTATSAPRNQQLSSQFAAVAVASDDCRTPADLAVVRSANTPELRLLPQLAQERLAEIPVDDTATAASDAMAADHPQQLLQELPEYKAPVLTSQADRLAELHAHIIAVVSEISLAAELELLLHLIALPPAIVCTSAAAPALQPMFASGAVAALYASTVLCLSGRLLHSLGKSMLESLAETPVVRQHAPQLMKIVQQELQVLEACQDRGYNRVANGNHMFGAGAFTQDGQRQRSQEEQRKVSNMNDCRDVWAKLMRTAAEQQAQPLKAPANQHGKAGPHQESHTDVDAAVLLYMHQHVRRPLRALRPDNYASFAELLTTALLQAAATGETLLDEDESTHKLQKLADKNTSKFYRLNQRMQGQALGQRPSHQGRYTTNSGGVKSGGSSPFHSPGLPSQSSHASQPQSGFQHHKILPNGNRGPQQAGLTEGDLADLQVAMQFPQAQRLFIMFLQAADSHRLNSSLIRCMGARLQQMQQATSNEPPASDRARIERLVSQCCLASFLSFLTFTANATCGQGGSDSQYQYQPPADLDAALHAALLGGYLEWVLPWVTQYLRFLTHDPCAHSSHRFQQVLLRLRSLHSCKALLPQSAAFGPVALCLRSLLDGHLEQVVQIELVESALGEAWSAALQFWEETADLKRPGLDVRYMQLCCPALEHARQAVQASISAGSGSWNGKRSKLKGVRKITPSQPTGVSFKAKAQVPPAVAAVADGTSYGSHPTKLKLQQAFLEQYSAAEDKVRLKDIMDYIIGIIAQNAVSNSIKSCMPHLQKSAAAEMTLRVERILLGPTDESDGGQLRANNSETVSDGARLRMDSCAQELVSSTLTQAMEECYAEAARLVAIQAVRALAALSPPHWTATVIGTAAALVAEAANQLCAQQIVAQISSSVHKQIRQQVDNAGLAACKAKFGHRRQSCS